jgi:3-isopropylmalate/(R)-2-methylmalate dehydratase large subunit
LRTGVTCARTITGIDMSGRTLFEKIWAQHVVMELSGDLSLLAIDRHYLHDLEGGPNFARLENLGYRVHDPDLTYAMPDHAIASSPGRTTDTNPTGGRLLRELRRGTAASGIKLFDIGQDGQGIVHVAAPEMGLTLPGAVVACPDSHTCTHGGLGALAIAIGSSEVAHVLATQTLRQKKPKTMRIRLEGARSAGVSAKDVILSTIGQLGTAVGRGHAVEYSGSLVNELTIEERLTICNLSIELGSKTGLMAPDDTTYEYLAGRTYAPKGALFDRAVAHWRTLPSDQDAVFDAEHAIRVADIAPQITWGTSPQDVIDVTGRIPDPSREANAERRKSMEAALAYMGLRPGDAIEGTPVDWVFIGSCTNGRLSDLREAANALKGRKVAQGVRAWIVPGSGLVRRAAEREGLHRVFIDAGFEWREPGCSMCLGANGDIIAPGKRSVSTTNRNFVGRQGPGARTHLASPAMAVAAAVTGRIADVRKLGN